MMSNRLWLVSAFLVFTSMIAYAEQPPSRDGGMNSPPYEFKQKSVTGTVTNIKDGMVSLKTDEGAPRELALKQVERERIKGLAVGDRLRLKLNWGDMIISINRVGAGKATFHEKIKLIDGKVEHYDPLKRVLKIKLPDGASKSFRMKDAAATMMNNLSTGTPIKLEIDLRDNRGQDLILTKPSEKDFK